MLLCSCFQAFLTPAEQEARQALQQQQQHSPPTPAQAPRAHIHATMGSSMPTLPQRRPRHRMPHRARRTVLHKCFARALVTHPSDPASPAWPSTALLPHKSHSPAGPKSCKAAYPLYRRCHAHRMMGCRLLHGSRSQACLRLVRSTLSSPKHRMPHLSSRNVPHKLPCQSSCDQPRRSWITRTAQHSSAAPKAVKLPICCCSKGVFPPSGNSNYCLVFQWPQHTAGRVW